MEADKYRVYTSFIRQGSTLEAKLFMLTVDFTLEDWRALRTDFYWYGLNLIPHQETVRRLQYQLKNVVEYTEQKKLKR